MEKIYKQEDTSPLPELIIETISWTMETTYQILLLYMEVQLCIIFISRKNKYRCLIKNHFSTAEIVRYHSFSQSHKIHLPRKQFHGMTQLIFISYLSKPKVQSYKLV